MAMALANQSQTASDALQRANQSLREEIASLFREASRHGALERELQLKKVRHAIELGNVKAAQNALDALEFESAQTAHKVKELQERLNLASSTPEEISRLEVEVRQAEALHRELSKHLPELEEKHSALSAQLRELPERIQKTERLILDLQKSRKQALIHEINEIWDRVKRLHEGEGI
jgi:predicted  nucleic acid-binding Zn-ribbon protein